MTWAVSVVSDVLAALLPGPALSDGGRTAGHNGTMPRPHRPRATASRSARPRQDRAASALPTKVERRNATFQHWQTLLTNRTKRLRAGEMIVQGVRPITLALEHGHTVRALLTDGRRELSSWAQGVIARANAPVVTLAEELLAELGEREDGAPELLAVIALPDSSLAVLPTAPAGPLIVFDRPSSPGNIGSLARSVDALGGAGLVVTGHAADPYDPAAVRGSTGSLLAIPLARADSPQQVLDWVGARRADGYTMPVIGTDEHGDVLLPEAPLEEPCVIVIGSETRGMSAAWREACDLITSIPMGGSASSLNAASAGTVVLYEALRRGFAAPLSMSPHP